MSDDNVDKVDYYESFEIYKNATNQIIEKARSNRSFSFEDIPVDPRELVAGHNIKELKEEGFVSKVNRSVDWGVEQRSIVAHKTKAYQRNERYKEWCENWTGQIKYLLEQEVKHTIKDISSWVEQVKWLREKMVSDSESAGCFGKPHYLDSELSEREDALNEIHSQLLEKRNIGMMGLAVQAPKRYFGDDSEK